MTDFIPGDSYRIDIVGADSTLIIDSWLSQIKANVVNRDGVIQVDTTFGKLYGPLIGNIENDEGDILFNSDSRTVHMDVVGNVKDTNNATFHKGICFFLFKPVTLLRSDRSGFSSSKFSSIL